MEIDDSGDIRSQGKDMVTGRKIIMMCSEGQCVSPAHLSTYLTGCPVFIIVLPIAESSKGNNFGM